MDERWERKQSHTNKTPLGAASTSRQWAWNACIGFVLIWEPAISTAGKVLFLLCTLLSWKQIFQVMYGRQVEAPESVVSVFPYEKQNCLLPVPYESSGTEQSSDSAALLRQSYPKHFPSWLFSAVPVLGKRVLLLQNYFLWGRPVT